jgi:hypothetical protein
VYNRFNRWSQRGIWQQIFERAADEPEPPEQVAVDSTHVGHRCQFPDFVVGIRVRSRSCRHLVSWFVPGL